MPWDGTVLLGRGVGAGLTPLVRDPRDGGVIGKLLSCRSVIARGGDLDFPLESDDPVAPILSLGFVLIGKDNGLLILRRGVNTTVHTQRHLFHVEAWQDKPNFR